MSSPCYTASVNHGRPRAGPGSDPTAPPEVALGYEEDRLPVPALFRRGVIPRRRRAAPAESCQLGGRGLGWPLRGRADLVLQRAVPPQGWAGGVPPDSDRYGTAEEPARRRLLGAPRGDRRLRPRPHPSSLHALLRSRAARRRAAGE